MADWPPITVTAIPDPAGTDPLLSYPLRDSIIVTELVAANDAVLSPENRVAEYISSRTETLRSLLNEVIDLFNQLPDFFLDRDGEFNITIDVLTAATGRIELTGLPVDGETFTLNDGDGNTSTFEFDDDLATTGGNVSVTIGASAQATASNIITAVNNVTALGVSAVTVGTGKVKFTNTVENSGDSGNVAITGSITNGTITGMSGGLDANPTNPAPSYMRGNLDLGGFKVTNLADAVNAQDLVTFTQYEQVLFDGQDDVEQIIQSVLIALDGSVAMGADLDVGGNRVEQVASPPIAVTHMQPKDNFDSQISSIVTDFINLTGTNTMLADLSMQQTPSDPRNQVVNVGLPTSSADCANKFFLDEQIALIGGQDVPVGAIIPYFAAEASLTGRFLICDGREVSRATYQALFNIIGVAYGTPSNVNVFKLPDLRGRTVVGLDNMGGVSANRLTSATAESLGGQLGEETHILTVPEIPSHDHSYTDTISSTGGAGALAGSADENSTNTLASSSELTDPAGSGQGHQNMQPSMAGNWIIRY